MSLQEMTKPTILYGELTKGEAQKNIAELENLNISKNKKKFYRGCGMERVSFDYNIS